jgi:hypothetical protein
MQTVKRIFCLALALLGVHAASAQNVPGYMGKRFSIGYSTHLALNLFEDNYNTSTPNDRELFFGFSNQHYLLGEYVLTKKISLTGSIGYSRAYFTPEAILFNSSYEWDKRAGTSMLAFVGGVRMYTQHLAPVGRFVELYVGYQSISPDDFDYTYNAFNGPSQEYTITPEATGCFLGGMKFGHSMIIGDQFKFEYFGYFGFQSKGLTSSSIVLSGLGEGASFDSDFTLGNTPENQITMQEEALGRMWASHILGFGLTVGFMP